MAITPTLIAEISFDDPSDTTPAWTDVTSYVRWFDISRGRENELDQMDAGTVTVGLDNRDRRFDPTNTSSPYSPNVLPMRRLRLRATWLSTTYDLVYGYIEDWQQEWPGQGKDAVCVVRAVDAFKVFAMAQLEDTNPPGLSYGDVVAFDEPHVYIPMNEPVGSTVVTPSIGGRPSNLTHSGGAPTFGEVTLLAGSTNTMAKTTAAAVGISWNRTNGAIADFGGGTKVTVEAWVRINTANTNNATIFQGRMTNTASEPHYWVFVNGSEQIEFRVRTSASALQTTSALTVGTIYHVVSVWDGTNMNTYLNGSLAAGPTVRVGTLDSTVHATTPNELLCWMHNAATSPLVTMGAIAVYNVALSTSRITAHYEAGLAGFTQQAADARIGAILDVISWPSGLRNLDTGGRTMIAVPQGGANVLDAIRETSTSDGKDAIFFMDKTGRAAYRYNNYRSAAPYNVSQATFGDGVGEIPYSGLSISYDESFLFNHVMATRRGGTTQVSEDATSQTKYMIRHLPRDDLLLTTDAIALTYAGELKDKFKDPAVRVTSIDLNGGNPNTNVQTQMLARELGEYITIKRRPPGGGAVISQASYIQKIEITANIARDEPWEGRFVVTPR